MRTSRTHSPTRRRCRGATSGLVALALVGGLGGCVSRDADKAVADPGRVPASALSDVVLRVGDQKGGTEALLRASGDLTGTPYHVEFSTFTSGPPEVEAANAGRIDFAVTGNTPPVFAAGNAARIRVVSAYGGQGKGDQILVPTASPVRSVADLKGRKVTVGKNTSAHGNLLLQLKKAGMTMADIQPVFLQPAEASAALRRGDVDAWAIWDPFTAIAETEGGVRTLVDAVGVTNGFNFGLASADALGDAKRATALADLLVRLGRAGNWSRDHPAEWASAYAAAVGISPDASRLSQDRTVRVPVTLVDCVSSEQTITDAFVAAGDLKGKVDFAAFVDDRFARDIAPTVGGPASGPSPVAAATPISSKGAGA